MKITTYNIWNNQTNFDERMDMLIEVLREEDSDVLALQEVKNEELVFRLKNELGYKYHYWKKYHDYEEGLAMLSKHEIKNMWSNWDDLVDTKNNGILYLEVLIEGKQIGLTNLHLDYEFPLNKEIGIIEAIQNLGNKDNDYNLLLGDFNASEKSSVYRFLTGEQSLKDTSTVWLDLGETYAYYNKSRVEPTLDFENNPRWDRESVLDVPLRFDWIFLEEPYPKKNPKLVEYKVIGKKRVNNITPSDHYGVSCIIDFE